ncbi:DUF3575 domain-containing protein [uncultured Winogradskyella sp.]|uniref:DUF3575 domain-containing protein n=1 Tax=uncultured Winogradskyella sp. TaxID=395353 RepID=UPI002637E5FB|nr:DUF3575 domain-containing protein [uncultured Winogradskyella sp.]
MKKLFLAAFAVFAFANVNAQENVVKVNPLGLIFGSAQFSYERVLNEGSSVELSLAYTNLNANFSSGEEAKVNGFGAEGKYKLYFSSSNDAPRGWYGAPVVSYSSISGGSGSEEGKVNIFGAGVIGGYQWVFGGNATGFALDLNLGVQYINVSTSGDIDSLTVDGILPRLGLSIGYAW